MSKTVCGHTFKQPSVDDCKCEKCGMPFIDWFNELSFQESK